MSEQDERLFWAEAWNTMQDLRVFVQEIRPVLEAVQVDGDAADKRLAAVLKVQRENALTVAVAVREGLAGIADAQERGLAQIAQQLSQIMVDAR